MSDGQTPDTRAAAVLWWLVPILALSVALNVAGGVFVMRQQSPATIEACPLPKDFQKALEREVAKRAHREHLNPASPK